MVLTLGCLKQIGHFIRTQVSEVFHWHRGHTCTCLGTSGFLLMRAEDGSSLRNTIEGLVRCWEIWMLFPNSTSMEVPLSFSFSERCFFCCCFCFYHEWVLHFCWMLFLNLFIWTHGFSLAWWCDGLHQLTSACWSAYIPGINQTELWCIILIYPLVWFAALWRIFYIYVHKRFWSVVFISCNVFIWFGY